MNDIEFLATFVGPCQHVGVIVVHPPGEVGPYYKCTMQVKTQRGISYRCSASQPLTPKEIRDRG